MQQPKKLNIQAADALPVEQKIQLLTAKLDLPLRFHQIPQLRGALVEAAGRQFDFLHNHQVGDQAYHYRYPLVQYKVNKGRAMLLGINEGADVLREVLLSVRNIQLNGADLPLRLYQLKEQEYTLKLSNQPRHYRLQHWLALNEENYRTWLELDDLSERVALLERVLAAHLLSFAKGMQWQLPEHMEVKLVDMVQHRTVRYHDVPLMAFDVVYKTNLELPTLIGLGKAVSHGYGWQIPYSH